MSTAAYERRSSACAALDRLRQLEQKSSMTATNDLAVRRALENAGVEFIDGNGGGPGVRLAEGASTRETQIGPGLIGAYPNAIGFLQIPRAPAYRQRSGAAYK